MEFKPNKKKKAVIKPKNTNEASRTMVKRQILVGLCLVVFFSLLGTGVYKFTRIDSLQIKEIKVVGGKTIPHSQVESLARDAFSGTYFKLIPHSFKYTFSEESVIGSIKSIDRVNHVQVDIEDKDNLVIIYDEYIPVALWCEKTDSKKCLFLDRDGYAFAEAPELNGGAFVRVTEEGTLPQKRQAGFQSDFMRSNQSFIEKLEDELGLYVTVIEKLGDYDIEYTVSGGGKIKVSQTTDLEKSFRNLRTILQSEEFVHIANGDFQYIDLRFGDKVFVNEEIGLADTSTSSTEVAE